MFSGWILLSLPVFASAQLLKAPGVISNIWSLVDVPSPSSSVQWTAVLQSADLPGLESRTQQIALDPSSPWLSEDEVASHVGPTSETKSAVEAVLKTIPGATYSFNKYGDHVTVYTTVAETAKLFSANFSRYQVNGSPPVIRTHSLTIPSSISSHVRDVYPLLTYGSYSAYGRVERFHRPSQAHRSTKRGLNLCCPLGNILGGLGTTIPPGCNATAVTSSCLRSYYGYDKVQPTTPATSAPPAVGIMAYIGQNYNPCDLDAYLHKFRSDAVGYSIKVNQSNGAINDPLLVPGVEADLDTQTVAGMVYPLSSTFYDTGTQATLGDLFLITFQNFLNMNPKDRPSVISISYGSEENGFTTDQAQTMCNVAMQLTCQGMTIVVSSGDSGVDGNGGSKGTCTTFTPTYPSGCPWILSVGATEAFNPETAAGPDIAGFYGGAGFSNVFSTPPYQQTAVQSYLSFLGQNQKGNFNPSGRGYPDVSAQGSHQYIVNGCKLTTVGGTSASAPIFASGLALLNYKLLAKGKRTVGFINPILYGCQGVLTDITSGASFGCANNGGFKATQGWDPSTGLGTPNLPKMLQLFGAQ